MKHRIENWLYRALGSEWCGNTIVPCDNLVLRWTEQGTESVAAVSDDAFVLYLGTPSRWEWSIRRQHVLRLAWFIIRWRIFGEWLGVRRAIWYWLLHRRCERSNRLAKLLRERAEGR
jgi:hypothetical protein